MAPDGLLGALCDPEGDEAVAAAFTALPDDPATPAATRERRLRAAATRWRREVEGATLTVVHRGLDPA